LLTPSQRTL